MCGTFMCVVWPGCIVQMRSITSCVHMKSTKLSKQLMSGKIKIRQVVALIIFNSYTSNNFKNITCIYIYHEYDNNKTINNIYKYN